MSRFPNENILKLRELSEKLNVETIKHDDNYKVIVKNLKKIVDEGKVEIEKTSSPISKIKCYENMCVTITNLLSNVRI